MKGFERHATHALEEARRQAGLDTPSDWPKPLIAWHEFAGCIVLGIIIAGLAIVLP